MTGYEVVTYFLPPLKVLSASKTGVETSRERGPFCVSVKGSCLGPSLTKEQVEAYTLQVHGEKPTRIERKFA